MVTLGLGMAFHLGGENPNIEELRDYFWLCAPQGCSSSGTYGLCSAGIMPGAPALCEPTSQHPTPSFQAQDTGGMGQGLYAS